MPAGLRREHRTRPGVWGLITVVAGRLRFRAVEPPGETVLAAGDAVVVAPGQPHEVEPDGPVQFYVESTAPKGAAARSPGPGPQG